MRVFFEAGEAVKRGTYLDVQSGYRLDFRYGGVLPAGVGRRFVKVSTPSIIIFALLAGTLFVITLPFIGIATLLSVYLLPLFGVTTGVLIVGGKAVGAFLEMVGRSVSFGWRPMSANLAQKRKKRIRTDDKDVLPVKDGKEETK